MHPTLRALLDLHDINRQRQLLRNQRESREGSISAAQDTVAQAATKADEATRAAHEADALIRQYEQDIANAEARIETLREKQMAAKTNKEYLTVINGIEDAKNIKKIRGEKLTDLRARITALQETAEQAVGERDRLATQAEAVRDENQAPVECDTSEAELERIYQERRRSVDSTFLEAYERLVAGKHPMPLMPIDPQTRATPYGNLVSLNHIERIRKGLLVCDHATAAILYVDEAD